MVRPECEMLLLRGEMKRFVLGGSSLTVLATLAPVTGGARSSPSPSGNGRAPPSVACVGRRKLTVDDGALKVATFNVLHSETDEGDVSLAERLPLIADAIVASGADCSAPKRSLQHRLRPKNEYPQKHGLVATSRCPAQRPHGERGRGASRVRTRTFRSPPTCKRRRQPARRSGGGDGQLPRAGSLRRRHRHLHALPDRAVAFRRNAAALVRGRGRASASTRSAARRHLRLAPGAVGAARKRRRVGRFVHDASRPRPHDLCRPRSNSCTPGGRRRRRVGARTTRLPDFLVGDFNSTPAVRGHAHRRGRRLLRHLPHRRWTRVREAGRAACSGGPRQRRGVLHEDGDAPPMYRTHRLRPRPSARGCSLRVPSSKLIGDVATKRADGRFLWPSDHYAFVSTVGCAR